MVVCNVVYVLLLVVVALELISSERKKEMAEREGRGDRQTSYLELQYWYLYLKGKLLLFSLFFLLPPSHLFSLTTHLSLHSELDDVDGVDCNTTCYLAC
jgi:hypothetical protein